MSRLPHSSVVGSLMYVMVCSRPNLAYTVSAVNRYMAKPCKEHWKAVKWIMRYLRGSSSVCLQFGRTRDGIAGYVDSDYAGDLDKRRSLIGYVFTIGGCAISWKAILQSTVALLTTEVEYMAVTETYKETLWLKGLFGELSDRWQLQSVIFLIKDHMFHEKTKHIDVRYHFVCEIIARGDIVVRKVETQDNPANMITKSFPIAKLVHCSNLVAEFALWGFVVEKEYGFNLVLRYGVYWRFSTYDGNSCQGEDC